MENLKKIILGCACLCLILFCLSGCELPEHPPVETEPVISLDLSGAPIPDLDALTAMTQLETLSLRGTGLTIDQYDRLRAALPGCEILWDVPFQGGFHPHDLTELTITSLSEEDLAVLSYFPNLNHISAEECTDYARLCRLCLDRPDCRIDYTIQFGGQSYSPDTTQLTLPGNNAAALLEELSFFPALQSVTLQEPLDEAGSLLVLEQAYPQVCFDWSVTYRDTVLSKGDTTTLDLTGTGATVEEMDALIPYLSNLTYVDMTDCGISNEDMDALNRRHESVKIVWTVSLGYRFNMKTDSTWFMPGKYSVEVFDWDIYNLRYCTDMIAIDLGHMDVTNCDFCAFMPNLQFLLLGDTLVRDLTPLTGLTNLVYLEIFMTPVTDYAPLLTLSGLEDLNLCFTYGDPEIIAQMTWLKNCWWAQSIGYGLGEEGQQMLREALPDCHFAFPIGTSTGEGWRDLPNYFKQRDIFGMYYMTG